MRPLLPPSVRRLWRDTGTVQLGSDPARAHVLTLDEPGVARLLELFDGNHTLTDLRRAARRHSLPEHSADRLLDAVRETGLLRDGKALLPAELDKRAARSLHPEALALALRADPGTTLARRRRATVRILGEDRLAVPIAAALAMAGTGQVSTQLTGRVRRSDATVGGLLTSDHGRPRAAAAADAIRRAAGETSPTRNSGTTLFVLAGHTGQPATLITLAASRRRAPVLPLSIRDGHVLVGPLVRPGSGGPCLRCLDLHRAAADPAWPALAAQLATSGTPSEACETALAMLASGYAAAQALAEIDGAQPETLGRTVTWSPDGRSRSRRWHPHPDCDCQRDRGGRHIRG
ncbi:hypothetical protein [Longispora albida]|uniref:hypothetical protein n=1 Tax=Longispora albida TaxID=203523 RepID=UPI00035F4DE8|nr:hypothetical protein [Longispora albida]